MQKYVGLPLASGTLRTGRPLSLDDALRHGLLNEVLELTDLTGRLERRFRVATDGGFMTTKGTLRVPAMERTTSSLITECGLLSEMWSDQQFVQRWAMPANFHRLLRELHLSQCD